MWGNRVAEGFSKRIVKDSVETACVVERGRAIDRATAHCLLGCTHSGMYKLV